MIIIVFVLVILIVFIYNIEPYKSVGNHYQNHNTVLPSNINNEIEINNTPRRDSIHHRHPYLFIINELGNIFPEQNPLKLDKHNSVKIYTDTDNIRTTAKYIIKQLENKYKKTFFLIETKNQDSYTITDKYNQYYKQTYSIYDLIFQLENKLEYVYLNIHIASKDIISVQYISSDTLDHYKLHTPYTDNYLHSATFKSDKLI